VLSPGTEADAVADTMLEAGRGTRGSEVEMPANQRLQRTALSRRR
jgi:hypothetical protein